MHRVTPGKGGAAIHSLVILEAGEKKIIQMHVCPGTVSVGMNLLICLLQILLHSQPIVELLQYSRGSMPAVLIISAVPGVMLNMQICTSTDDCMAPPGNTTLQIIGLFLHQSQQLPAPDLLFMEGRS